MRALLIALSVCLFCSCLDPAVCGASGSRTYTVTSTGLPSGLNGTMYIDGETVVGGRAVVPDSGVLVMWADPVVVPSSQLVRTVYMPTFSTGIVSCHAPDASVAVSAEWSVVPTSQKLWTLNQNGTAQIVGLDTFSLDAGHDEFITDAVGIQTDVGQFTFDKYGNVWATQGTLASSALNYYPAADFASSGTRTPAQHYAVSALSGCIPGATALAMDLNGSIWLASLCDNAVFKLGWETARDAGTLTSAVKLTVPSPGGLAFDKFGRLFVASRMDGRVYRFDAAQLNADATEPAAKIGVRVSTEPTDETLFTAGWLAFDANGALWFNDFGANYFASIPATSLNGTGSVDVQPGATRHLDVAALLENFAFDEQGGLWSAASPGKLLRLAPEQLTGFMPTGENLTPERVIQSPDLAYVNGVALYPAPAGLPLFHSLP